MTNNISVIGLGKLGASMAAGFASKGFNVVGYDINEAAISAVNAGVAPVQETDLNEMIQKFKSNISATSDLSLAINSSDISFVVIPTPSEENGSFSLKYAKSAFTSIGKALKEKNSYHVIVMTSTVLPGSTSHALIPLLEEYSGKKCGADFGVCYNPEFIALGSVIKDFLNPDFYLLGQYDQRSGDLLESVHTKVSDGRCPVQRMGIENAELAKIALNSYVTLKVSFANMLAEFCEKIPGGDVDAVSDALGTDSRIGRKYLTGGLGFAGPCFPRDNVALAFLGDKLNVDTRLLTSNQEFNEALTNRYIKRFDRYIQKDARICVLGLAYKALSHVVEESAGVAMCNELVSRGHSVIAHDNLALEEAKKVLDKKVMLSSDIDSALENSDVVMVMTGDADYVSLSESLISKSGKKVVIIDFWRALSHLANCEGITYVPMGTQQINKLDDTLEKLWI
jgi:UDPglucose 6-dehydrogenase